MARRKCCCKTIFVILGFLRMMGGFPYTCRYKEGRLEVRKSALAIIWTFLVVTTMVVLSVSCIVHAPAEEERTTDEISSHILNYITYSVSAAFFPYLALRSPRLARTISRMDQADLRLGRRVLGWADFVHILCFSGVLLGTIYTSYITVLDISTVLTLPVRLVLYHIPASLCDPIFDVTAISLGFLLYFLFKVLALETEDAIINSCRTCQVSPGTTDQTNLPKDSRWSPTEFLRRPPTPTPTRIRTVSEVCDAASKLDLHSRPTPQADENGCEKSCRRVLRRLLTVDDLVVEMVEYAGPPVALILLSSTVNATVMLYLTITTFALNRISTYYLVYIVVKVLGVIQVTFVPDSLIAKRIKCLRHVRRALTTHSSKAEDCFDDVEKVLATGTPFVVCRLFTLERHVILSVAHSVVTYLVIALQFSFSEDPVTEANCTSDLTNWRF